VVRQWLYSGATVMLQQSYSGVTVVLQWRHIGGTVVHSKVTARLREHNSMWTKAVVVGFARGKRKWREGKDEYL
jgi:hypothetical protein